MALDIGLTSVAASEAAKILRSAHICAMVTLIVVPSWSQLVRPEKKLVEGGNKKRWFEAEIPRSCCKFLMVPRLFCMARCWVRVGYASWGQS